MSVDEASEFTGLLVRHRFKIFGGSLVISIIAFLCMMGVLELHRDTDLNVPLFLVVGMPAAFSVIVCLVSAVIILKGLVTKNI